MTRVRKIAFVFSWFLLMLLTAALIFVSLSSFSIGLKGFLILVMMLIQAYLVSFYFMQLRLEKFPLVWSVVSGIFLTTGILYFLILWDGTRIIRTMAHP